MSTLILLVLLVLPIFGFATFLHSPWAPLLWATTLALAGICFRERRAPDARASRDGWWFEAATVFAFALALRLYRIHDLPLGPYVDELQTLRNVIALSATPFDLFGMTPLFEGWVHTHNLYLYFDWLILWLFGVDYLGMKLFSVIPGAFACVFVLGIACDMFERRTAFGVALLFAFGHWPLRLGRYGWDVSFMVMVFAAAVFCLLRSRRRDDARWAYAAGVAMGVGLYSYLGARACLLSLLTVVVADCILRRDGRVVRRAVAFVTGIVLAAFPLLLSFIERPELVWLRPSELSLLGRADALALLIDNVWRHATMFHLAGGVYARDNLPGIPMMDAITGLLLLVGCWTLLRRDWRGRGWVIFTLLLVNFLPGLLSVSQEGGPYVYRVAAVMVPAFLIAGVGLEALHRVDRRGIAAAAALVLAFGWNTYLYFGLEPTNVLAARVTVYHVKLIADQVRRTSTPVYIIGQDTLEQRNVWADTDVDGPPHLDRNPPFGFSTAFSLDGVRLLSGRTENGRADSVVLASPDLLNEIASRHVATPALLVFRPGGKTEQAVRARFPHAGVRWVADVRGGAALGVLAIGP